MGYVNMNDPYSGASTSFGGCDIIAVGNINGKTFHLASMSSINISVVREKSQVYFMGRADASGIVRGKRALSGQLTAVVFDKDAMLQYSTEMIAASFKKSERSDNVIGYTSYLNEPFIQSGGEFGADAGKYFLNGTPDGSQNQLNGIADLAFERVRRNLNAGGNGFQPITADNYEDWVQYPDQIYPFDLHVIAQNEYGDAANMVIYGIEFTSDAMAMSINDMLIEKPYNFIARGMRRFQRGFGKFQTVASPDNLASSYGAMSRTAGASSLSAISG